MGNSGLPRGGLVLSTVREGTVLVTGGTGFLGTSLLRRLLHDGERVRVLVRSPPSAKPLADRGAEVVVGDIADEDAVATAVDGVTTVYHLAGRLLVPGVPVAEYRRTHFDGTRLLIARCRKESGLERFVHCSTTGVLGITGRRAADEDSPFRPTNIYEATKADAEFAVRQAWRDGLPAVIARPGLVYGPGDLHLLGFFRSVLRRRFRRIGRRDVWLHPIYIDDLTEGLILCGRHPAALGECFHLAGRRPVALAQLAAAIAEAGGTHLPPGHIPLLAARAVATVIDLLPDRVGHFAPLTRNRLDFLTHERVYDVSKARRMLGFSAATDLPTGAARSVAWYRREGHLPDRQVFGGGLALSRR
jgi:nucleoside-diphosphate-sugar epimerase